MKASRLPVFLLTLCLLAIAPVALSQSVEALFQQGNAAQAAGNYSQAAAIWQLLLQREPKNAAAYNNLGAALYAQQKLEEAMVAYRQAITLDPKSAAAYNNLGNVLRDQKKLEEAMVAYRQAITLDPKSAAAYNNLGNVLRDQKKLEEAMVAYRQAITLDPKFADAYNGLGNALRAQQKLEEAIAAYRQAITLDPKYTAAYNGLGNALRAQQKLEEAIAAYRQAITLDPKYTAAYNGLGNALRAQQKLEEAIAAYRQAITLDPKFADAYNNLGTALSNQKKLDKAIAAYRQAITLDPKFAGAYNNLGNALSDQKKLDEALVAYRKALNLPDQQDILSTAHTLAHNGLGFVFQQQGQLTAAIREYQLALKLAPSFAYAQSNLLEAQRLLVLKQVPQRIALGETRYLTSDTVTPLKRSVVKIIARFPNSAKGTGYGTGFVVKREGNKAWIVTNRHVVLEPDTQQRGENLQVELYYGNPPEGIPVARLEKAQVRLLQMTQPNDSLDLAVLEVTDLPADIQPLPVRQQAAGDRLSVRIIGHSGIQTWQVDETESLGFVNSQVKDRLLLRIDLRQGASGSPILDAENQVVGVLFSGGITLETTGLGAAYPINVVMTKLAAWGVKLP